MTDSSKTKRRSAAKVRIDASEPAAAKRLGSLARSACAWMERFIYVDDEGSRLRLYPAQLKFLRDIYRTDRAGNRVTRVGLHSVARGNGKTSLAAAITLHDMSAAGCTRGGWWFIVANTKEQAGIAYNYIVRMIGRSDALRSRYEVAPSAYKALNLRNGNAVEALASNPASAQGRRPTGWIADEIAEFKDNRMLTAMTMAATKVTKGCGLAISTNATAKGNVLVEYVDMIESAHARGELLDHVIHRYAADLRKDGLWTDKALKRANPGLLGSPPLVDWSILESDRVKAKHSPIERFEFVARRLNASSGITSALVDPALWQSFGASTRQKRTALVKAAEGSSCRMGIDLSRVSDMSAVVLDFDNGLVISKAWLPAKDIDQAEILDKVPYRAWAQDGWLDLCDGPVVDYGDIADYILDALARYQVGRIQYDPYMFPNLKAALEVRGVDTGSDDFENQWLAFRQGYPSYTPAIVEAERRIRSGEVVHLGDPVLATAITGIRIESPSVQKASEAMRPVKAHTTSRIDCGVAWLMSVMPMESAAEPVQGVPAHFLDMIGA